MTATNHAITGAIIATVIDKPLLALPLALLSHFVQDTIPHFGRPGHGGYAQALKYRLNKAVMLADPIAIMPVLLILLYHHVGFWVYAAGFLAVLPDFYDFVGYFVFHKNRMFDRFSKFANTIQWCERPWGIWVDIAWYIGGLVLLWNVLS